MSASTPVDRGPAPVARLAERSQFGWQWVDGAGVVYSVQHSDRRRIWTARAGATVTVDRSLGRAIAPWPLAARAVFRRTLRPHGLLR
jgi:hypothetical protein